MDIKAMPNFSFLMGNRRHYNRLQDLERRLAGSHRAWEKGYGHLSSIQTESYEKLSFLSAARCALFRVLAGILQHGVSIQNKYLTVIYVRRPVLSSPVVPHADSEVGEETS